jgi:hypothetical protein
MEMIDAEVTELRARWHLSADADVVALIHAEQERIFMEESGLARARPEARICFSRPVGYTELLENVQIHGYHLMHDTGRVLTPREIADDWYERVYLPAVEAIRREGLDGVCSQATEADLFLCVYQRRRELFPEHGCRPLEEAARQVGKQGRKQARWQLRRVPDLQAQAR